MRAESNGLCELGNLPDLALLVEIPSMVIVDVGEHVVADLGWTRDQLVGRVLGDFVDQGEGSIGINTRLADGAERETVRFDRRVATADGHWRTFNFAARVMDQDRSRLVMIGREVDAFVETRARLNALLELADLTDDIFLVADNGGNILYTNAAATRIHGPTVTESQRLGDFIHGSDTGLDTLIDQALASAEGRAKGRVVAKGPNGEPVTLGVQVVYDRATERWFAVERDITATIEAERRMQELAEGLRHQATTDALTGVANRFALNEELKRLIDAETPFALMLLDMDDFKSVNDTLGHAAGDDVLRRTAQRIRAEVRGSDLVARLGGDEFVVVLPGADHIASSEIAERLLNAISDGIPIGEHEVRRSCSIGVAIAEPGEDASTVLRKADRAAYRAKHDGRCRFAV